MTTTPPNQRPTSVLRLKIMLNRTGLGRSTAYNLMNEKSPYYDSTFPRSIRITQGAVGWLESEIEDWIASRVEASRA